MSEGLVPLTRMRQQIARVTVGSKTTIPHFYVTTDIDMTAAMSLRREINQSLEGDVRVSVNDLVIKACVHTIRSYPKFNSSYTDDGIRMHESINIGMAIADDDGLIMPAILDCEGKSLTEISAASKDLARRSQSGTLQAEEYTGGTFSISNMGMFDVTSFVASFSRRSRPCWRLAPCRSGPSFRATASSSGRLCPPRCRSTTGSRMGPRARSSSCS